MEPIRLELEHFLGYSEATIDLAAYRALAIVGDNGAGKSSLVDAILWALYGESSKGGRRELDDHIQSGHDACRVALEFRLGGQRYRVERTRHRTRNRTMLALYRDDAGHWQPMGAKASSDTQAILERLLRLDYRTFTASAILLQNQADVFTRGMTDTERKAALAAILGLDLWERIGERNTRAAAAVEAEAAQIGSRLEALRHQAEEEAGLRAEQQRLMDEQASQETRRADVDGRIATLEAQLREQSVAARQLEAIDRRLAELAREQSDLEARAHALVTQRQQVERMLAHRADIEAAVRLEAELQTQLQQADAQADRYATLLRRQHELERAIADHHLRLQGEAGILRQAIASAKQQAAVLDQVPCRDTDLPPRCPLLAQARKAASTLAEAEGRLQALEGAPPLAEEDQLVEVLEEIERLHYDPGVVQRLRTEMSSISALARRVSELAAAEATLASLDERMQEIDRTAQRIEAESAGLRPQREVHARAAELAHATERELARWRAERAHLEQELQRTHQAIGRIEARLEQLAQARQEAVALEQRLQALAEARTVHALLREACSPKGGVPALVVENAVPQIEEGANALLQQLSAGRMRVALETQRQTKTTGAMAEALAVRVYVDGAERPYTFLSGAQQWLTDVAVRISLSRLLQARAGAEVGLLVIDEGFGSLDAAGRARVAESIAALSMQFRKLLVITHLAEMQDILPARIRVTRDGSGSRAVIEG